MIESRYYYDGQMGFEDDYAYQTGSYGSSTSHLDITRYALGARGIDRIEKTTSVGESSEASVTQYPLYDAHGNMVATLSRGSSSGTYSVGNQRAFEPWGSVFDSSGLSNTPKQAYCASIGHVADGELGLTYMRARYYEPTTGRFMSEDPARQGRNWIRYADNDPVSLSDRSGLEPLPPALFTEWFAMFANASMVCWESNTIAKAFCILWSACLASEAASLFTRGSPAVVDFELFQKFRFVSEADRWVFGNKVIGSESVAARAVGVSEALSFGYRISTWIILGDLL